MSTPQEVPGWVPTDQVQQMIDAAIAQYAASQPAPAQHEAPTQEQIDAQIQRAIDTALAQQAEVHNKQLEALSASLRGQVQTYVPHNAGGVGTEIHDTWSQWEQEQAHAADEASRRAA